MLLFYVASSENWPTVGNFSEVARAFVLRSQFGELADENNYSSANSISIVWRICFSPGVPCQFISPCHQRRMKPFLSIR